MKKAAFSFYVFLSIAVGLVNVLLPLILSRIIDVVTNSKDMKELAAQCGIFFLMYLFNLSINCVLRKIYITLQTNLGFAANRDIVLHLQKLPLSFFTKMDIAYLSQRVNNDANETIIFALQNCGNIIINALTIFIIMTILIHYSATLALILLGISLLYPAIYYIFRKQLRKRSYEFKESQSTFFSSLQDQLSNLKFIKLNSAREFFLKKWNISFTDLYQKANKMQDTNNGFSFCTGLIDLILQIVSFAVAGIAVMAGSLTIGIFVVITNYISSLKNSLIYFYTLAQTYQQTYSSYMRIKKIMDIPEQTEGSCLPESIENIRLEHINFGYGPKLVFKDYSYQFEKNNIYGIAGKNGCGKTTLANLMLGIYNGEYTGDILYNDINISAVNLYELKKQKIGITEQEPVLAKDTILSNLTLGLPVNMEAAESFYRVLEMEDFIKCLPDGLNTIINEKS